MELVLTQMDNIIVQKVAVIDTSTRAATGRLEANNAIIELNKSLMSPNIGKQCEAIVKIAPIMLASPLAFTINAVFHKFADTYLTESNLIKVAILQAIQPCEKHLQKLSKIDDFYRKIFSVSRSTDPVARAITLRVLGQISSIVPERKNAHHFIHDSLSSNYREEVDAAIFAAKCFCEKSQTFCAGVCARVMEMIQEIATPNETKLELLGVFMYMGHDPSTALQVKNFSLKMLESYPTKEFVVTILNTLTKLSLTCKILVTDNLIVLTNFALQDSRSSIQIVCCKNLQLLAQHCSHLWDKHVISSVLKLAENSPYTMVKTEALHALFKLTRQNILDEVYEDLNLFEICLNLGFHKDSRVCVAACNVVVEVTVQSYKKCVQENSDKYQSMVEQADSRITSLFTILLLESNLDEIMFLLRDVIKLMQILSRHSEQFSSNLSNLVVKSLSQIEHPSEKSSILYETLISTLAYTTNLALTHKFTDSLMTHLANCTTPKYLFNLIQLLVLLYNYPSTHSTRIEFYNSIVPAICTALNAVSFNGKFWFIYKIARLCLTIGVHELSQPLLRMLSKMVVAEDYRVFILSMSILSQAETFLIVSCQKYAPEINLMETDTTVQSNNTFDLTIITKVIKLYANGIAKLSTCQTMPNALFSRQFFEIRISFLSALHEILLLSNYFLFQPQLSSNSSSFDYYLNKFNHFVEKMYQNLTSLRNCKLLCFDANNATLSYLRVIQLAYESIIIIINKYILNKHDNNDNTIDFLLEQCSFVSKIRHMYLYLDTCSTILREYDSLGVTEGNGISHLQIEFLRKMCFSFLILPFPFPKYIFESSNRTEIELSFINLPEKSNEPILVPSDTSLSFSIEGVVLQTSKSNIASILLKVLAQYEKIIPLNSYIQKQHPSVSNDICISKQVKLKGDTFDVSFLIHFPKAGVYILKLELFIIDDDGENWLCASLHNKLPTLIVHYSISNISSSSSTVDSTHPHLASTNNK